MFLGASIMCRTLCPKMSFICSVADMSDERTGQSMRTTLKDKFADSGKMCSGVVILGLVLALVLVQERQDGRPQHLIHVRLADRVPPNIITRYVALGF